MDYFLNLSISEDDVWIAKATIQTIPSNNTKACLKWGIEYEGYPVLWLSTENYGVVIWDEMEQEELINVCKVLSTDGTVSDGYAKIIMAKDLIEATVCANIPGYTYDLPTLEGEE